MKKLLALLLAIFMMTTLFVGCGDKEESSSKKKDKNESSEAQPSENGGVQAPAAIEELTAQNIEGTWTIEADFEGMMALMGGTDSDEAADLEMIKDMDLGKLSFKVSFNDGKMKFDKDSLVDAMSGLIDKMLDWFKVEENFYKLMGESMGMSADQVKAQLEASGIKFEEYVATLETQFEGMDEELLKSIEEEGSLEDSSYVVKDGKLYSWGEDGSEENAECMEFEYDNGVLNVVKITAEGQTQELAKGVMIFKK